MNGVRTEAWTEPKGLPRKELLSVVLEIKNLTQFFISFLLKIHTNTHLVHGLRVVSTFGAL